MFYKIVENTLQQCPKNGVLCDGVAVSNLHKYFEANKDIAAQNGYYPLEENFLFPFEGENAVLLVENGVIKIKRESEE